MRSHESVRHGALNVLVQLVQTYALQPLEPPSAAAAWHGGAGSGFFFGNASASSNAAAGPALGLPALRALAQRIGDMQRREQQLPGARSPRGHASNGSSNISTNSGTNSISSSKGSGGGGGGGGGSDLSGGLDQPTLELAAALADAALAQQRRDAQLPRHSAAAAALGVASGARLSHPGRWGSGSAEEAEEAQSETPTPAEAAQEAAQEQGEPNQEADDDDDDDDGGAALGVSLLWRACLDGSGASAGSHAAALNLLVSRLDSAPRDAPAGQWALRAACRRLRHAAAQAGLPPTLRCVYNYGTAHEITF